MLPASPPPEVEVTKSDPPSPLAVLPPFAEDWLPPPLRVDEVEGAAPAPDEVFSPVPVTRVLPAPPHDATATTSAATEEIEAQR